MIIRITIKENMFYKLQYYIITQSTLNNKTLKQAKINNYNIMWIKCYNVTCKVDWSLYKNIFEVWLVFTTCRFYIKPKWHNRVKLRILFQIHCMSYNDVALVLT